MTRNNGAHQCSPRDPGIQTWPFFLFQTPDFFASMKLSFTSYISTLLQTPSKKFKGDSRYTGSDNEDDDFNDFTMNKGFIQSFSDT